MQILFASWPCEEAPKKTKDADKVREGYAFIRLRGPKANNLNQLQEWADVQTNAVEDSPIFGWPEGKVLTALHTLMRGRATAKTLDHFPFTYKNLQPWFLKEVMVPMLSSHEEFGISWGGITHCGKSLASKTHAFHVSEYHIKADGRDDLVPSVVTAKNMDFFRGEQNTKYKPPIGDDWQMKNMRVEDVKAFFYGAEEDALLWARWGGSGFDMNTLCQGCTNPMDATVEQRMGDGSTVTYEHFVSMIRPSYPKDADEEDIDAIMRRKHTIWATQNHVYYRYASDKKGPVPRIPWPAASGPDFFKHDIRPWVKLYKNGRKDVYPGYEEDRAWSVELLTRLTRGESVPVIRTILPHLSLCGLRVPTQYIYPEFDNLPARGPAVVVKQEQADQNEGRPAHKRWTRDSLVTKVKWARSFGKLPAITVPINVDDEDDVEQAIQAGQSLPSRPAAPPLPSDSVPFPEPEDLYGSQEDVFGHGGNPDAE